MLATPPSVLNNMLMKVYLFSLPRHAFHNQILALCTFIDLTPENGHMETHQCHSISASLRDPKFSFIYFPVPSYS